MGGGAVAPTPAFADEATSTETPATKQIDLEFKFPDGINYSTAFNTTAERPGYLYLSDQQLPEGLADLISDSRIETWDFDVNGTVTRISSADLYIFPFASSGTLTPVMAPSTINITLNYAGDNDEPVHLATSITLNENGWGQLSPDLEAPLTDDSIEYWYYFGDDGKEYRIPQADILNWMFATDGLELTASYKDPSDDGEEARYITIHFYDDQGNFLGDGAVLNGTSDWSGPEAPAREGYTFIGWGEEGATENFSKELNGKVVVACPDDVTEMTYIAHYTKNPAVHTVNFFDKDGNGLCTTANAGDMKFMHYIKQFIESGARIPFVKGCVFDGWVTKSGDRISPCDTISGNLNVYASYHKLPSIPEQPSTPEEPSTPEQPSEPSHDCPSDKFVDVDQSEWYHDPVDWAIENGVMNGYQDGIHFGPTDVLTRAQVAAVLYNMAGSPEVDGSKVDELFPDCDPNEWYACPVVWAQGNGVFMGYDNGDFDPNGAITREQMAVVFWRIQGSPESDTDISSFPDADNTSSWAAPAVKWAVEEGLLKGYTDTGELKPTGGLARAECAAVAQRYVEKFGTDEL